MENKIKNPKHYKITKDIEAKDIIKASLNALGGRLTPYEAYCLGCYLKYRLRAGKKDDALQDIAKSKEYLKYIKKT